MIAYQDDSITLYQGDCIEVMAAMPDNSVDSIVTDPPYGLGFMGKKWDSLPPGIEWAAECLRVLKPGGHLLAFGGTRTWHRLAVAVEDAGFEIRDSIAWMYGSGFPKSMNVSKSIAATQAGYGGNSEAIRRATLGGDYAPSGVRGNRDGVTRHSDTDMKGRTLDLSDDVRAWEGWGTALKPAFEPIVVARKPLIGTVAANVTEHGTGALNIDGCRIGDEVRVNPPGSTNPRVAMGDGWRSDAKPTVAAGRWPANVVLDEDQAVVLDQQAPVTGGASRFFYVSKAPKSERPIVDGVAHPTVKPVALMQWLVRLVTPPNGVVLDPFVGSGATVEAAMREGFQCLAIEREAEYLPLVMARIERESKRK